MTILATAISPVTDTPTFAPQIADGLRLTDCYATAPVCSPSRAGLLTGRTANRTGVYDWIPNDHEVHLKREEITIATLLQRSGYSTAHVGKWHLNGKFNFADQPQPGDHGFDHWFATQNNAAPSHENPGNFVRNGEPVGQLEGFSCQLVADEGIRWLNQRADKDRPFFLNVWFHEPHEPVASPEELVHTYRDVAQNEDEAQYFANVTNMDAAVGRLLAALDELGVRENTFVYFSSDNGPETLNRYAYAFRSYGNPGPLRGMKLHIYEGGIRVPGIVRWPDKSAGGRVVDTPVSGVDLLPTVCELAGIEAPKDRPLDGASMLPIFENRPIRRSTPLFWSYYRAISVPKVALRDGDWKIVAHWDGPERPLGANVNPQSVDLIRTARLTRYELYNLREDLSETHDLSSVQPGRLANLLPALTAKYIEVQSESPDWFAEAR